MLPNPPDPGPLDTRPRGQAPAGRTCIPPTGNVGLPGDGSFKHWHPRHLSSWQDFAGRSRWDGDCGGSPRAFRAWPLAWPRRQAPGSAFRPDRLTAPEAVDRLAHRLGRPLGDRPVGPCLVRRPPTSDSQLASASSSRSQVLTGTASAAARLTWERPSVGVRWRPLLAMAIVTHLVTRPPCTCWKAWCVDPSDFQKDFQSTRVHYSPPEQGPSRPMALLLGIDERPTMW
jgi:hypothetical protein